ncbi:polysaccharide deacetylase [Pantoea sp. EA-12]|uniref:polysaccharide deacetylase n=1 Tax=Pantoea sp. EA-12 TaxID=3043303 RepID=UPI0024B4CFD6|nr:polysaccharide deacetylase [Pantoea sp. EA-12]MDI9221071.1 polysaccharide deacetylase [Pantoea sp. EA-12]
MSMPQPMWEIASHQRYRYSAIDEAPLTTWPQGKSLALYVAMNLEHFSFGCPEGARLSQAANQLDILNYSWRDYGNRVGGWYLADMFEELAIPPAVIANTSIIDYCPALLKRWMDLPGSELIAHGHTNSQRQGDLSQQDESALIAYCQTRLTEWQGKPVSGWLSPWISESQHTPDLLRQNGFSYSLNWAHDDRPVPMETQHGALLSVPYPQEINDIPTIIPNGADIETFCRMIEGQFAELKRRSQQRPQVMGIALHPYIVGQPFRLHVLRQTLNKLLHQCDDVWLTTPGEIASYSR